MDSKPAPDLRTKFEEFRIRKRTPGAYAAEVAIRERFRHRPGPDELLAMGEVDQETCDRIKAELAEGPPRTGTLPTAL